MLTGGLSCLVLNHETCSGTLWERGHPGRFPPLAARMATVPAGSARDGHSRVLSSHAWCPTLVQIGRRKPLSGDAPSPPIMGQRVLSSLQRGVRQNPRGCYRHRWCEGWR